ncbi:MAG TPA: hypothetical protein IAB10_01275 [Candidatus Avilachnospira avistercoris]|nr:hypothetical protein [Candidatus Avilachnospira avistercoris]
MKDISSLMFLLFCVLCALQDIRHREIHILTFLVFGGIGVLMSIMEGRDMGKLLLAMLPGALLMALALRPLDIIGTGDALWILTAAMYMGVRAILFTFSLACFLCVFAGLYIVFKNRFDLRRAKKMELPFTAILPIPILLRSIWAAL